MSTNHPADALFPALYEGDQDTVVRLLRAGVSAESVDEDGQSALYVAAVSDEPGIVRLLLAAGADPDRLSLGTDAPLCGAACGGHTEVVRALLGAGAGPDTVEAFGFTALVWALRCGHSAVAELLLKAGADPDRPGPSGEVPLVTAARRGSVGCVRALLAHGATARAEAIAEARRLLGVGVEAELRAGLARTHGPGHRAVTRRRGSAEGVTIEVELLNAQGIPFAGDELQTGHAEIIALLTAGTKAAGG
ncbi:ankyrin repeat domain-containing protein [Streptomyces sp. NPDC007084]|uniref:ankyrin repeat domain-containing protein n=1 Tax=Streptomyces sp. NPDC007084 TaxID=3154313 RepID=UPI0034541F90